MNRGVLGVVLGIVAAIGFASSGPFIRPLLDSGWSPGAAVLARLSIGAALLLIPGLIAIKGDLRRLWRSRWTVLLYASVAVLITQLTYYAAITRIPVSLALLIQYLAPILLILLAWGRSRRRPQAVVLIGAALSIGGLVLVIGPEATTLDGAGLLLAAASMIGIAVYYVLGAKADASLPPVSLAASGFFIGAVLLAIDIAVGLVPGDFHTDDVAVLGAELPWYVPLLVVGVLSTAVCYVAGIAAIGILGTQLASFLGLSEVVFAALLSWVLLGETLELWQMLGGLLILGGIVFVRLEKPEKGAPVPTTTTGLITVIGAEALPVEAATTEIDLRRIARRRAGRGRGSKAEE